MTVNGWTRLFVGLGTILMIVVAPLLIIFLVLDDGQVSPRELRIVVNGRNNAVPFNYSYGDSYGSYAKDEENAYSNSYVGSLIRTSGQNEQVKGIIGFDEEGVGHIFGDPTDVQYSESLRLELAEAMLVYDGNGNLDTAIFNDDEFNDLSKLSKYAGLTHVRITDSNIQEIMDGENGENTSIEFVVREDMNWIDSNGNETNYQIVADDFYYSMYHTGLSRNEWRNEEYRLSNIESQDNPFGGHGSIGDEYPEYGEDISESWQLGIDLDTSYRVSKFSSQTDGFSDSYLFSQFGIMTPSDMVKDRNNSLATGVSSTPNMMGNFNGLNTVIINDDNIDETPSQLFEAVTRLIADAKTLAPVPSQMIDSVESKKTHANGVEILPGIAKDLGFYTYGVSYDSLLYASPYYVSGSDQFRLTLEQNKYYWDDIWVDSQDTVSKYTIDFIESIDENIHSQSMFSQFKTGKVYKVDYHNLDSRSQREVLLSPDDFGVRYALPQNSTSFETSMLPIMMPEPRQSNGDAYLLDNYMAELWYGVNKQDMHFGQQEFSDYLTVEARAFRSQITASINWFAASRITSPDGSHEDWVSYMPPDINMWTSDDSGKTVYEFNEDLCEDTAYDFTAVNYIDSEGNDYSISSDDNYQHYLDNSDDSHKQMQSPNYDQIGANISLLIDEVYAVEDKSVVLPVKVSQQHPTLQEYNLYERYEETIEGLDPRLDVQFYYYSQSWPGELTSTNGTERYVGTEASYNELSSMFSALGTYGTSIQAMASEIKRSSSLTQKFPALARYAEEWEAYVHSLRTKHGLDGESFDLWFRDPSTLADLTGEIIGTMSGSNGELLASIHDYAIPPMGAAEAFALHLRDTEVAVQTFDSIYFRTSLDDIGAAQLISEVREIMGVTFGDSRSILSREIYHPVVYRDDLSITILENGHSFLQDWRVNQTRAKTFA